MKAIYWVISVFVVALGIFISIVLGDANSSTTPLLKLDYYQTEIQLGESIIEKLGLMIAPGNSYWIGVEPEKLEQLGLVEAIKNQIEKKNGAFDQIILDSELQFSDDFKNKIKATQNIFLKENIQAVADVLVSLEKQNQKYLLITASVYSASTIKDNPLHKIKEIVKINPLVISMGYYAAEIQEEQNILFPCSTEDKSGTSNWGCAVVNKARNTRRKFDMQNKNPWSGLLDLTEPNDYMLLVRKRK
ncbi:MAG: hypothetical protein WA160_13600 [Pseudobdellovibrio sp.]